MSAKDFKKEVGIHTLPSSWVEFWYSNELTFYGDSFFAVSPSPRVKKCLADFLLIAFMHSSAIIYKERFQAGGQQGGRGRGKSGSREWRCSGPEGGHACPTWFSDSPGGWRPRTWCPLSSRVWENVRRGDGGIQVLQDEKEHLLHQRRDSGKLKVK